MNCFVVFYLLLIFKGFFMPFMNLNLINYLNQESNTLVKTKEKVHGNQ